MTTRIYRHDFGDQCELIGELVGAEEYGVLNGDQFRAAFENCDGYIVIRRCDGSLPVIDIQSADYVLGDE